MNVREEAIRDCKYAASLNMTGDFGLHYHIANWLDEEFPPLDDDEQEYQDAIREIKSKLGTEECLLK